VFEELIGKHLGQYRIEEEIGEGGMATVFKAYQPSLKRWVAVKVLSEELARKQDYISRFEREARVAANLDHHHIVKVFDYGTQDNYYYIVMSYVEGSITLADLIQKDVPKDELLGYILQVADALEYAHKAGAIHRDVKPSNILIRSDGWPFLADFGLVRSETTTGDLTRTGMQMGTQGYMSPEQRLGIQVDHRTDIYALGAIVYKVLTGEPPLEVKSMWLLL
jgi:serine/threonine protein kinase